MYLKEFFYVSRFLNFVTQVANFNGRREGRQIEILPRALFSLHIHLDVFYVKRRIAKFRIHFFNKMNLIFCLFKMNFTQEKFIQNSNVKELNEIIQNCVSFCFSR